MGGVTELSRNFWSGSTFKFYPLSQEFLDSGSGRPGQNSASAAPPDLGRRSTTDRHGPCLSRVRHRVPLLPSDPVPGPGCLGGSARAHDLRYFWSTPCPLFYLSWGQTGDGTGSLEGNPSGLTPRSSHPKMRDPEISQDGRFRSPICFCVFLENLYQIGTNFPGMGSSRILFLPDLGHPILYIGWSTSDQICPGDTKSVSPGVALFWVFCPLLLRIPFWDSWQKWWFCLREFSEKGLPTFSENSLRWNPIFGRRPILECQFHFGIDIPELALD